MISLREEFKDIDTTLIFDVSSWWWWGKAYGKLLQVDLLLCSLYNTLELSIPAS